MRHETQHALFPIPLSGEIPSRWLTFGEFRRDITTNGKSALALTTNGAMEEVKYKRWTLEVDVAATRSAYNLVEKGGPEDCGSQGCQNFAVARENVYPQEVLTLFDKLGVDCTKEAEVLHLNKGDDGFSCYSGWLHFIGDIKSGKDAIELVEVDEYTTFSQFDLEWVNEHFRIGFTKKNIGLYWHPFQGKMLVQIEFFAEQVPWVLADAEEA